MLEEELTVQIKPMRVPDIQQVLEIERRSFPTPWSERSFMAELLDNDRAYYLVARSEAVVVGYCGVWYLAGEGHITNLAIHPHYRRHGLGWKLLAAIAALIEEKGGNKLTLEVRMSNKGAQQLYREFGFTTAGVRPGYYQVEKEDALIMWMNLTGDRGGKSLVAGTD